MADYDFDSFRVADEGSELLHRPAQPLAVKGHADFLGLCVQLRVPILNSTHNADTMAGSSPAGRGASSRVADIEKGKYLNTVHDFVNIPAPGWFRKWSTTGRGEVKARYVSKRLEAGSEIAPDDSRQFASITNEVRILSNDAIRSSDSIISLLAVSWLESLEGTGSRFWPQLLLERADLGTIDGCLSRNNIPKPTRFMIYRDVLDGLRHLHANGIVHGDVKPQNVLLCHDLAFDQALCSRDDYGLLPIRAKICDFGFSVILSDYDNAPHFKAKMGTLPWSAPELDGKTSVPIEHLAKADIYSAGLLIASVIREGETPFLGKSEDEVATAKRSPSALEMIIKELDQNLGASPASGLTRGERSEVVRLLNRTLAPQPRARADIDAVISGWDVVLQMSISDYRLSRGSSEREEQWSPALQGKLLALRYRSGVVYQAEILRLAASIKQLQLGSSNGRLLTGAERSDTFAEAPSLTPDLCYETGMRPGSLPRIAAKEILGDLLRQVSVESQSSADALFALSGCYINGSLVDPDSATALGYLARAAALNHPGAIGCLPFISSAPASDAAEAADPPGAAAVRLLDLDGQRALEQGIMTLLLMNYQAWQDISENEAIIPRTFHWRSAQGTTPSHGGRGPARGTLAAIAALEAAMAEYSDDSTDSQPDKQKELDVHNLRVILSYMLNAADAGGEADDMVERFPTIFRIMGGSDVNESFDGGYTVLQHAVLGGNATAVRGSLTIGVDIEAAGRTPGWTALWLSIVTGQSDIAVLLLDLGASPTCRDAQTGATVLHMLHQLTDAKAIKRILEAAISGGIDIDQPANGLSPLLACSMGWDFSEGKAAQALLQHGANPTANVALELGIRVSPISSLAARLDCDLLQEMLECPWVKDNADDMAAQSALASATCHAFIHILSKTEFYYLSILGPWFEQDLARFLQLIVTDGTRRQLASLSSGRAETQGWDGHLVALALWSSRGYLVRSLLDLFPVSDHMAQGLFQRPLIQIAIERRMKPAVISLLQWGADLLATSKEGYSALHAAAKFYPEILLELVDHLDALPALERRGKSMKSILETKDGRLLDVPALLLLEGYREEQGILTKLRTRFDLDMDVFNMPLGLTLTGFCIACMVDSGSVPMSQLEYLLRMTPKPKFVCGSDGTTLLILAVSGDLGRSKTARTPTGRLVNRILDAYPGMENITKGPRHGAMFQAASWGNIVALERLESRVRRDAPSDIDPRHSLFASMFDKSDDSITVLDAALSRVHKLKKGDVIPAIRSHTFTEALETYRYLRERGAVLRVEKNGSPLRSRMVYEFQIDEALFRQCVRAISREMDVVGCIFDKPTVFQHDPADPDVAEAIRKDPRMETGACRFRQVMLTWHFDGFYLHSTSVHCSPLRTKTHLMEWAQMLSKQRDYSRVLLGRSLQDVNLYDGPWKDITYTERVPTTTEAITWTRSGRVYTEQEVEQLCELFEKGWKKYLGKIEDDMLRNYMSRPIWS